MDPRGDSARPSSSNDIAGVQMRLTAGSYREMHWHTADEWAYVLHGNCRVTVMNPDGTMFIGDVGEGDLWIFPAGYPHSIEGLGPDGTGFLLVFNQGMFSEDGTMLLSELVAHTPPEVLAKNTGLDKNVFAKTPGAPLYIFPGNLPNSLEQDKAEIGGAQVASKYQYAFRMRSMEPTIANRAGEVRIVDSHNFPASKHIAAALLIIKSGHMRELHWHPNASEWQYYIAGKGRMTVFFRGIMPAQWTSAPTMLDMFPPTHLTMSKTRVIPTLWCWSCSQLTSSWMFP
jgi:oxalate decarboxylase